MRAAVKRALEARMSAAAGLETLRMLKVEQVADRLQVDRATVYRLLKRGELESVKVGRARRVTEQALADFARRSADRGAA